MKKLKTKTEMLRTNGQWSQSWARRFVKEVGLEPGVKERELWMMRVVS